MNATLVMCVTYVRHTHRLGLQQHHYGRGDKSLRWLLISFLYVALHIQIVGDLYMGHGTLR